MSAQFGRWNFDGQFVDQDHLEKANAMIAPYGPDDSGSYTKGNISIHYRAFHTTKESRRETQPHVTASGAVITWDGRLDNRAELIHQLRDVLTISSTDVSIVAAAYEEWGTECFAKLIGDWALSILNPHTRSLILVKDPVGTRHLYYSLDKDHVTWSTILDPLVLFSGKTFTLEEEYIAGWLSLFPAAHLTPYVGIHSVPPSSSVLIRAGSHTISKYWDFDPSKRIRYRTDPEYEEHFRAVFAEAVRRRLRSDNPILAELSGGMDSSSIVCMADTFISKGLAETVKLDTVSYYNDSEPNWNERPYFKKVEEKRGCTGRHIDVSSQSSWLPKYDTGRFAATPGSLHSATKAHTDFVDCLISQQTRVLLSGIGGDEVLGGVPAPTPELADLFARGQLRKLGRQLIAWALAQRKPVAYLFADTVRAFLPLAMTGDLNHKRPAPWLLPNFVSRNRTVLHGYENEFNFCGALPSFQANMSALNMLRRHLTCVSPSSEPVYEKRYPYLDRNLLEFLYAIPREQIIRPKQRRSLMRRSLISIVPEEILNRKRKAFVIRSPMAAISSQWESLLTVSEHMVTSLLAIVNEQAFAEALHRARDGEDLFVPSLARTLGVELWLQRMIADGILNCFGDETHFRKTSQSLQLSSP